MQTYAEQLRQVRDSLTPENWHKGSYFSNKGNTLCMCVHGAAQAIVNPEVKKVLDINDISISPSSFINPYSARVCARLAREFVGLASPAASSAIRRRAAAYATIGMLAEEINSNNASKDLLFSIWSSRPDWVKKERIYESISYGFVNLHYLMGMFGLTIIFNDSKNTTLDMLKDKLSEAAKWAEENEEFLRNN